MEQEDIRLQACLELPLGLTHTGEDDSLGRNAHSKSERQLGARYDFRSRPFVEKEAEQRRLGVCLQRVTNEVRLGGKSTIETAEPANHLP